MPPINIIAGSSPVRGTLSYMGSLGFDCCGVQWKEMFVTLITGENFEYAMAA